MASSGEFEDNNMKISDEVVITKSSNIGTILQIIGDKGKIFDSIKLKCVPNDKALAITALIVDYLQSSFGWFKDSENVSKETLSGKDPRGRPTTYVVRIKTIIMEKHGALIK